MCDVCRLRFQTALRAVYTRRVRPRISLWYNTQRIIAAKRMQGGSVGGVLEEMMGMGLGWGPSRVRR